MAQVKRPTRKVALRERTYCQIAGKDIAEETCFSTQGHEACFGCASPYRMCEVCRDRLVDVPAVGMCSMCLIITLNSEELSEPMLYPSHFKVECQLHGNRAIQVAMCKATQGQDGCRNCAAVTRLCEHCQKRAVRIVRYGMCLKCSVDEYGDGWNPHDIVFPKYEPPQRETPSIVVPRKDSTNAQRPAGVSKNGFKPPVLVGGQELNMKNRLPLTTENIQAVLGVGPNVGDFVTQLFREELDMTNGVAERRPTARSAKGASPSRKRGESTEDSLSTVVESTRKLLVGRDHISRSMLERMLKIDRETAQEVLQRLHRQGVIGPHNDRRPRLVLQPVSRQSVGLSKKVVPLSRAERCLPKAKELIAESHNASAGFLKQHLVVAWGTMQKIMALLERDGVVGPAKGNRPREILTVPAQKNPVAPLLRVPRSFKPVEHLISQIGVESKLGLVLRSLMEDAIELRRLKSQLQNFLKSK